MQQEPSLFNEAIYENIIYGLNEENTDNKNKNIVHKLWKRKVVPCKSHYSPIPIFENKNNLNIITTKRKNDLDDDSEYHVENMGDITVEKLDIGEIDSKNFENKDDISFGIISTNWKDGEFISKNFESEDNTLGIIFTNRIDNIKDNNSDNKKENLEIKKGGGLEKIGISEKFIEIPPCFMETININEDEVILLSN